MRVLLATHLVPFPPDSGGKAVSADTLVCLSQVGSVDVCTFQAPWTHRDGTPQLRQYCRTLFTLPLRRRSPAVWPLLALRKRPYYVWRDYSTRMEAAIRAQVRAGCDVLLADSLHMAPYVSSVTLPKVLQQHNVESYLAGQYLRHHPNPAVRVAGRWEQGSLEAFEREQCNAFDAVIALSDVDAHRLRGLGVRTPITVVPPAVHPVASIAESPERKYVVHVGTIHWPPVADGLAWYIRDVHPRVRRAMPDLELLVAGAPPTHPRALPRGEGVRMTGYVEDLTPVYRAAAVFIVPLRIGGGVRIKILHALARGLAVVSTSAGCEGLGLDPGRHLLVADTAEAFAAGVVAAVQDAHLRRQLGEQGRAFVLERFRPEARCARLDALIRTVAVRSS